MSAVQICIRCVLFWSSRDVVCGINTETPIASISNHLFINSELQLLQPNEKSFLQQWLHLALLFVTVQAIFQRAVSKDRSGNIRNKTSVSLIKSTLENYTYLFLHRCCNLGRTLPLFTHCCGTVLFFGHNLKETDLCNKLRWQGPTITTLVCKLTMEICDFKKTY